MPEVNKYIIVGYSGHAWVVAEAAALQGYQLLGYTEKKETQLNPFKLQYLGDERSSNYQGWKQNYQYILGIGENSFRVKAAELIRSYGQQITSVIHPDANVSDYSTLESGSFIARNAAINPMVKIGRDVIVNTSASIDHECVINNGAHIAPGAILCGNVSVGREAFIGAGSVVREGVRIGDRAIIGAGSVVLKDVKEGGVVFGNPAKSLKK